MGHKALSSEWEWNGHTTYLLRFLTFYPLRLLPLLLRLTPASSTQGSAATCFWAISAHEATKPPALTPPRKIALSASPERIGVKSFQLGSRAPVACQVRKAEKRRIPMPLGTSHYPLRRARRCCAVATRRQKRWGLLIQREAAHALKQREREREKYKRF